MPTLFDMLKGCQDAQDGKVGRYCIVSKIQNGPIFDQDHVVGEISLVLSPNVRLP
jgi:hypothetical protein